MFRFCDFNIFCFLPLVPCSFSPPPPRCFSMFFKPSFANVTFQLMQNAFSDERFDMYDFEKSFCKVFLSFREMNVHNFSTKHKKTKTVVCADCPKKFKSRTGGLQYHRQVIHNVCQGSNGYNMCRYMIFESFVMYFFTLKDVCSRLQTENAGPCGHGDWAAHHWS
jgi:hypothetical protein